MKLNILICGFTLLFVINLVHGSVHFIGNDTIHYDNGKYFKISVADTFYIDTTRLFVRYESFANASGIAEIESRYELTLNEEFCFPWWKSYFFNSNQEFINLATSLNNESLINMIEFNTNASYECESKDPNDYNNLIQWYLNSIQADNAWAITTGDPEIIVAILDSGFDWEHLDLGPGNDDYDNIYLNDTEDDWRAWNDPTTGEKDDDDYNGYEDDWKGWGETDNDVRHYDLEFLYDQFPNSPEAAEKVWRHGTYIAGIIGAKSNNNLGIPGIAGGWNKKGASLLLFKLGFTDQGGTLAERIAKGICYASDPLYEPKQARIIEMAFSIDNGHDLISTALDYAYANDVFLVAASGNSGGSIKFPANYQNVFSVGATDNDDYKWQYSSWYDPVDGLDLSAPGVNIYGLEPEDGYTSLNGTSPASAMVAGTAALMLSINPELSIEDITNILHRSADKVIYDYDENEWCEELGYGRLNTYKAVCMAGLEYTQSNPEEITIDETWSVPRSYLNSVHVKPGVLLTITSEIQFGPAAKLIIEPGAIVEVDGGILTNLKCCEVENISWPGIEVWGNRNESQYTPGAQGKLILNEAIIENAVTAVDLWKPGYPDNTGGIIDANDALFRNNARSVHAIDYRNFNPSPPPPFAEMDYCGTFTDCSFNIDNNYLGDVTFYKHVDLDRVRGIKFYGCTFSLDHTATNVSPWNLGIAAYNAGFNVLPTCTTQVVPCPLIDSCRFNGFHWAIGAYNNSVYPVLIVNAHFDDNVIGVYISSTNYPVIIANIFDVGFDENFYGTCGFANGLGIDIHSSSGFAIENNKFRKNLQAPLGIYAGIRAYWCRTPYDLIYKNEFRGLSYGNYAEGINRRYPLVSNEGIEYQCNQNFINIEDFRVTAERPEEAMIRGTHGNRVTASGNRFSRSTSPNNWDFWYGGTQIINWHYCETPCIDERPVRISEIEEEYFVEIESPESNDCPNHYGGGGHINLSAGEKIQKELDFTLNQSDYDAVYNLYESLKDGGNTQIELNEIQTAEPDEMWDLRSQLLGHSPHLSQDVLRAVSDRNDIFPDDVLLEILAANPDELNRDTLLSYLEQKDDPLPDYMIEILRQAVGGVTYKTILLDEMARYQAKQFQAAQDIIRSILYDTLFNAFEYRNWLDNLGGIEADKQIISSYLNEKDTNNAKTLLYLLPILYELEGEELADYLNYQSIFEMQIGKMAVGKTIFDLDSLEIEILEEIAIDGQTESGNLARNILTYAFNYQYCDCMEFTDSTNLKSFHAPVSKSFVEYYGLRISAIPNPAHSWVALNYELPLNEKSGDIRITDITGIVIHHFKVYSNIGQDVWDTRDVRPGLYYVTLISSGLTRSVKLVIL